MNKFNGFVDFLLEADVPVVNPGGARVPTGNEIMELIYAGVQERPDHIRRIKLSLQSDPQLQETLNDVNINTNKRMALLGKALGIASQELQAKGLPSSTDDNDDFQKRPSITRLGKQQGTSFQADIERAFWDSFFWINKGTWLKKLEIIGKGISKAITPTTSGSTGVFA